MKSNSLEICGRNVILVFFLLSCGILGPSIISPAHGDIRSTAGQVYEYAADLACYLKSDECCREPYVRRDSAIEELRKTLKDQFFGQHIATDVVVNALDAHLNDENPKKPLVFSFHGWAGSGKTYLANLIASSLYKKGSKSKYVRMYTASYNFPDKEKVNEYWERIQKEIEGTLSVCENALIIFDEVDVTPSRLFDSLVAFLESHSVLGVNHRKAVYIFLSNIGSNAITQVTMTAWKDGKKREELSIDDFHDTISMESFNAKNTGLSKTRIIERVLVDYFVPFLPMERRHIIECAKAEMKRKRGSFDPELIADKLAYWPADLKLFSQTGCKRIEQLVKYYISESKFKDEL